LHKAFLSAHVATGIYIIAKALSAAKEGCGICTMAESLTYLKLFISSGK